MVVGAPRRRKYYHWRWEDILHNAVHDLRMEKVSHSQCTSSSSSSPTVALVDQWRIALKEESGLDDADCDLADADLIEGGVNRISQSLVTVAVVNNARELVSQLTSKGQWFLIVDECHQETLAKLTCMAKPDRKWEANQLDSYPPRPFQ